MFTDAQPDRPGLSGGGWGLGGKQRRGEVAGTGGRRSRTVYKLDFWISCDYFAW
jgi:hypothetical protein